MIDLIIDTSTNTVFNTFEYTGIGFKAEDYIQSWTNPNNVCSFPAGFSIEEVEDFERTILPARDGYRTEFRYDPESRNVYEIYIVEPHLILSKIAELTEYLSKSDYKIIKSYEAQLAGLPAPYDIDMVHAERQSIRDRINELENLLN